MLRRGLHANTRACRLPLGSPLREPENVTEALEDDDLFGGLLQPTHTQREPHLTVSIHLDGPDDLRTLGVVLDRDLTPNVRSLWWPHGEMSFGSPPGPGSRPDLEPERDLFGNYIETWRDQWHSMPEFVQPKQLPWKTVQVHVPDQAQAERLELRVGKLYHGKWCWWPARGYTSWMDQVWSSPDRTTRHPVYIISKGRWEKRLTARALDRMGMDYTIVVEPQEYDQYAAVIRPDRIAVLPFSNLGQGSIPARNWVWEDSIRRGASRHWILDDNIGNFYRLNRNVKRVVRSAATFRAAEDFTERYSNVGISGMNYEFLVTRREACPPYTLNTRVYSCILIRNDLPYRWRGTYNEDTDLSLRALKDGHCTVLFNSFLAKKEATMISKGGNTDELYAGDGRLRMAESLRDQHPDVTTVVWKWDRWQHQVDYSGFRQPLERLPWETDYPEAPDEYGMELTPNTEQPTTERSRDDDHR